MTTATITSPVTRGAAPETRVSDEVRVVGMVWESSSATYGPAPGS
jgi:hypothetical protein